MLFIYMIYICIYINSNSQAVKENLTKNNHTLHRLTLTPHLNRKLVHATIKVRFSSEEEPKGLL